MSSDNGLACGRCGGTATTKLQLGDRETPVCRDCQSNAAGVLNHWMFRRQVLLVNRPVEDRDEPSEASTDITPGFLIFF